MKTRVLVLATILIGGLNAQALAASVKISGTYLVSESKNCQAILNPVTGLAVTGVTLENVFTPMEFAFVGTGPFLVDLNADTGHISSSVGLVTFSGGSFSGSMFQGKGASVDYNGLGQPISASSGAVSGSFSMSGTSFMFNGLAYQGFVGGVTSKGVANIVRAINVTPPCIETLNLDHQ